MTDLALADDSVAGLLSWWSLVHLPDDVIPLVFADTSQPGAVIFAR
jgi:hypothetical protein